MRACHNIQNARARHDLVEAVDVATVERFFFFFFNRCSLYSAGLYGGVDYTDSGGFGRGTGGMPRRPSSNCTGAKSANCTGEK